jgi:hypothetical protein
MNAYSAFFSAIVRRAAGLRRAASAEKSSYADGSLIELYDNPALKRTAEDRRAEWARLFARIPEGQAWVSGMLKIRGNEAFHEILRKAGALIDLVFKMDLSRVEDKFQNLLFTETERTEKPSGLNQLGYYDPPGAGPAQFHVWRNNPHPLLTALHEIGHHLAQILGEDAVNAVAAVARETRTYERITGRTGPEALELLKPHEIFARVFAQDIVTSIAEMKDAGEALDVEGLEELGRMKKSRFENLKVWPSFDFSGVRHALKLRLNSQR